ncbi:MAG: hypothetical protein EZS28_053867, partial [Streblomastix strix]
KEKERIRLKKQKELDKARNRRNQRSGTDDRGFCSWTNTLIDTKETDITFSHSNFTNWWIGIVSVNSGVLTVDDCLFYGNGELNEQFPYVRQNIRCYQGMVDVKSMRDEDGLAGIFY